MKKIVLVLAVFFGLFALVACTEQTTTTTTMEVTLISITATSSKVTYNVGETLDKTTIDVVAYYSDSTNETLADDEYTVAGFNSAAAGVLTVTITFEGKTAQLSIVILEAETIDTSVLALQIAALPDKLSYRPEESFDYTGLVVKAIRANGEIETISRFEYVMSGFDSTVLGSQAVTLTFEDKTISFNVFVNLNDQEPIYYEFPQEAGYVQGVTETTIKVGNTAATSGFFAVVGVPFNAAIRAVFERVNEAGGIDGRMIEFVTYDDQFSAANGIALTEKLVEEDEVFALVGHFGTPTVGSTLDYIKQTGIPMVYAATGINNLYRYQEVNSPVLAVQPIYLTDGRIMTARAVNESVYGAGKNEALPANAKIGVLYTNDDAGNGIADGVREEADLLGIKSSFNYQVFDATSITTAVSKLKTAGVQSIIIATNQASFKLAVGALNDASMTVPVFTSYVNADKTAVDANIAYGFDIYTNAWVDVLSPAGQAAAGQFVATIGGASFLDEATKLAYYTNAYATAGYIAAEIFVEGLMRVMENEEELNWENYVKAMEQGPITVPMGSQIDFSYGKRWGIAAMSLLKYNRVLGDNPATTEVTETDFVIQSFVASKPIESIDEIEAK